MQSKVTACGLGASRQGLGIFNQKRASSKLDLKGKSPSKANKIREQLRASRMGMHGGQQSEPAQPNILDKINLAQSLYVSETPDLENGSAKSKDKKDKQTYFNNVS